MNKKTIAYILIAGALVAAVYYFFIRKGAASSLGAGMPDNRGSWAADDDKAYNSMRSKIMAQDSQALGWIDPLVEENYTNNAGLHKIKGMASKAGSLLSIFEAVNPNTDGQYFGEGQYSNQPQLFPESLHKTLWNEFNALQVKYGGL